MLKVHCVGVLLLFEVSSFGLVGYARFWLREDSHTFLNDKEKEGKGTFCGPRLYLQNTGAEVRSRGGCNMYGSSELDAPALSCDCCCYLFPFHTSLPEPLELSYGRRKTKITTKAIDGPNVSTFSIFYLFPTRS